MADTEVRTGGGEHPLVIQFGPATLAKLRALEELEELDTSTIVNRAVQMYWMLDQVRRRGGEIYLRPDREAKEMGRLRWQ